MKKTFLLLMLIIGIGLFSCDKGGDDDPPWPQPEPPPTLTLPSGTEAQANSDIYSFTVRVSPVSGGGGFSASFENPNGSVNTAGLSIAFSEPTPTSGFFEFQATGSVSAPITGIGNVNVIVTYTENEIVVSEVFTLTVYNPSEPQEICNNGLDDDLDGEVDEGCPSVVYKTPFQNLGPYVIQGQQPGITTLSEAQARNLVSKVAPYTEGVRIFGSSPDLIMLATIAKIEFGLKVALTAWLTSNTTENDSQISSLISAINAGIVDIGIVGSEVLFRQDLTEAQLVAYINYVKSNISVLIPITTTESFSQIYDSQLVRDNVDVICFNIYPYWQGESIDIAVATIHQAWLLMLSVANGKQVILSESGWPTAGDTINQAIASPENAAFFFLTLVSWARANDVEYMYFESFDEPWKEMFEGLQGRNWGIFNVDGTLKPGMQDPFDGITIPDNWS